MEPDLRGALDNLRALLPLEENSVERFFQQLEAVVATKDPSAIRAILAMVDDSCELGGVNDAILNALEVFPSATYVPRLLEALPEFRARSARWSEVVLKKLMWSPSDTAILKAGVVRAPPDVQKTVREMLMRIRDESKDLRNACDLVLSAF